MDNNCIGGADGEVVIELCLDDSSFEEGLSKAEQTAAQWGQDIEESLNEAAAGLGLVYDNVLSLSAATELLPQIGAAFVNMGASAKTGLGAAGGGLKSFGSAAERAIPTLLAATAALLALGAAVQTLSGKDLADMTKSVNAQMEGITSAVKNAGKNTGGYAAGTSYAGSGWYLVGENGPELMRFRGGEAVLNATRTAGVLQGAPYSPAQSAVSNASYTDNSQMVLNVNANDLNQVLGWWRGRRRAARQGEVNM